MMNLIMLATSTPGIAVGRTCHALVPSGPEGGIQRSRGTVPRGCACSFGTAQRRRFACYYGVRNQSSMFHMSDAVLGFLR